MKYGNIGSESGRLRQLIFTPSAEDGYRDLRDSLRKDDGVEHTTILYHTDIIVQC
jgi:hypothetical protein